MSFCKTMMDAEYCIPTGTPHTCVECGKGVSHSVVTYDVYYPEHQTLLLHRRCASLMGQRLVCDAFLHRHAEEHAERGSPYS
jgi:hypothetical protein